MAARMRQMIVVATTLAISHLVEVTVLFFEERIGGKKPSRVYSVIPEEKFLVCHLFFLVID